MSVLFTGLSPCLEQCLEDSCNVWKEGMKPQSRLTCNMWKKILRMQAIPGKQESGTGLNKTTILLTELIILFSLNEGSIFLKRFPGKEQIYAI